MPRYYGGRRYGYAPGPGWGRGRGFGFGGGLGGGGWCWWPRQPWCRGWGGWWTPPFEFGPPEPRPYWEEPPFASPQEEMAALKEEESYLRHELEAVRKRLGDLEKESQRQ
jgi:hypothetical protein